MVRSVHEIDEAEYFGRTADRLDRTQMHIDQLRIHASEGTVQALAFCGDLKNDETLAPGTRLLLSGHGVVAQLETIREMTAALLRREPPTQPRDSAPIKRAAERALKELKRKSHIHNAGA